MKHTLAILTVLLLTQIARAADAPQTVKPNVVIFIADDLTWHDVACFGGPTDARTPNLDRMAAEGTRFT